MSDDRLRGRLPHNSRSLLYLHGLQVALTSLVLWLETCMPVSDGIADAYILHAEIGTEDHSWTVADVRDAVAAAMHGRASQVMVTRVNLSYH